MSYASVIVLVVLGVVFGASAHAYYMYTRISPMPYVGERVHFIRDRMRMEGTFLGLDKDGHRLVRFDDGTNREQIVYGQLTPIRSKWRWLSGKQGK